MKQAVVAKAWLAGVLHRIAEHPAKKLDQLLPRQCKAEQQQEAA